MTLEEHLAEWRAHVSRRHAIADADVVELEEHLREQVADLAAAGLDDDEAFLIAVKRMGSLDDLSHEFAVEHSERLWKQLVRRTEPDADAGAHRRELAVVLWLAVAAAVVLRLDISVLRDDVAARLAPVLVLPFLGAYFGWKRRVPAAVLAVLAVAWAALVALLAAYPFDDGGDTEVLATIHAPVVLWLLVGVAYVGGEWRSGRRRMDFIRFTGEWVVYYTLLALGGGTLLALTLGVIGAVGGDPEPVVEYVLPMGAAGAVLVAAWLVEAKQSVIENIAPVLTKVFTPLTIAMLAVVLIAFAMHPDVIGVDRDLLVLMTAILVLVLGLLLYAVSARDPLAPPGVFDGLQTALIVVAIVVDGVLLVAMLSRIAEFGASANKLAALGLNLVLLVNLVWSTWLELCFLRGRRPASDLERWQTSYVPVYAVWAAVVVVTLPPSFGFA